MQDLLDWWVNWGAIVFLITTIFLAALVIFDAANRRARVVWWQVGALLAPALILPSVLLKTQLEGSVSPSGDDSLRGLLQFLFWIGVMAGLAAVIDAIGYFMSVAGRRPALPPPPPAAGLLYVKTNPWNGRDHRLLGGATTIGRGSYCNIVVDDLDVSRDHAHILEQFGRFMIVDRGSRNGTFLNGERVQGWAPLNDGDEIRLGPNVWAVFKQFFV